MGITRKKAPSPQHQRHAKRCRQGHHRTIAFKQRAHGARPGVMRIGLRANLREGHRQIDAEFMRRRILAGVIAALAAVTEIGQMRQIASGKFAPHGHGGKDGAIAFAIAAGIAHRHVAAGFRGGFVFL